MKNLLKVWKENKSTRLTNGDGQPLSIAKQCAALMRHTLRKLIQGELSAIEIKNYGAVEGALTEIYRIDLPSNLAVLATELLQDGGVSMPELFRASIRLFPDVANRSKMETEYVRKGGVGDAQLMSDDFLFLWNKYNGEGPVEDGVRIIRALRDLELKFQAVVEKVDTLNTLFYRYGIEGVLNSEKPPLKKELEAMDRRTLNAVAKRWGISVPRKTQESIVRRTIMTHFGYSRGN